MTCPLAARCRHCEQLVLDSAQAIGKRETVQLREHLLGCPNAIAAVAPSLPIARTADELLKHFAVRETPNR